jgi:ribonuclease P protein component
MVVLKKRSEFLAVAKGGRVHKPALTLQYLKDQDLSEQDLNGRGETHARFGITSRFDLTSRFGLTVTKKTGNSVVRSRIKRRLRAAVAEIDAPKSYDFVLIARDQALTLPFHSLKEQLQSALHSIKKNKG